MENDIYLSKNCVYQMNCISIINSMHNGHANNNNNNKEKLQRKKDSNAMNEPSIRTTGTLNLS